MSYCKYVNVFFLFPHLSDSLQVVESFGNNFPLEF